jgi:hypothetical protein
MFSPVTTWKFIARINISPYVVHGLVVSHWTYICHLISTLLTRSYVLYPAKIRRNFVSAVSMHFLSIMAQWVSNVWRRCWENYSNLLRNIRINNYFYFLTVLNTKQQVGVQCTKIFTHKMYLRSWRTHSIICEMWGFHGGGNVHCGALLCYALQWPNTFRMNVLLSSSRLILRSKLFITSKQCKVK